MRVLLWHVHGSWTTAFVHGWPRLSRAVPPRPGPGWARPRADVGLAGLGGRGSPPRRRAATPVDVVVLQRPHELEHLAEAWLGGRRPGVTCRPSTSSTTPRRAGSARCATSPPNRPDLLVAHVTHFNALFWDCGSTRATVVEHGVVDPGYRYTGELPRSAVVINEARRRGARHGYGPARAPGGGGADRPVRDGRGERPRARVRDRRRPPGPAARRARPPAGVPASDPLDVPGPVAHRGDAPGHAGRRAGDHGGARRHPGGRRCRLDARRAPRRSGPRIHVRPRAGPRDRPRGRAARHWSATAWSASSAAGTRFLEEVANG